MIIKRDSLLEEIKTLNEEIREERKKTRRAKRAAKEKYELTRIAKYRSDAKKTRELAALFIKSSGETYKGVGDILGVSPNRARQLVETAKSRLNWLDNRL